MARFFRQLTDNVGGFTIFLDDLHLLDQQLQPEVLSQLYSFSRGNRVYLKISSIEQFSRIWDPARRAGLEMPNDAQAIKLDYNLTDPRRSREHIESILNAHARYCALPDIHALCYKESLARLVWVAAGVPRDALYILSQAMLKAASNQEKKVSVTSINVAASEAAEDKLRAAKIDASKEAGSALEVLEYIKEFCIKEQKKNAFLVELQTDEDFFKDIEHLIGLRFLHVLNPGITPHSAGERWMAILLDYGFYVGRRAAKNLDLFKKQGNSPEVKELRKLPKLRPPE